MTPGPKTASHAESDVAIGGELEAGVVGDLPQEVVGVSEVAVVTVERRASWAGLTILAPAATTKLADIARRGELAVRGPPLRGGLIHRSVLGGGPLLRSQIRRSVG